VPSAIEKMRQAKIGRQLISTHKANISAGLIGNRNGIGRHLSVATREKIKNANLGRVFTAEHRARISESRRIS